MRSLWSKIGQVSPATVGQGFLLALCFLSGYLTAGWWEARRETTPLEDICAGVEHLFENSEDITTSKEWQHQFFLLKKDCDALLHSSAPRSNQRVQGT